jgi:hypothetical protein
MQIVAPYKTGMVDTANHLGSLQQSVISKNSYYNTAVLTIECLFFL